MSEHIIKALLEQNDELKARVKELEEYVLNLIHILSQDPAHIIKPEKKIEQLESDMKALGENQ
jgi:uncharacterized coiled-coil DUF342 family protein